MTQLSVTSQVMIPPAIRQLPDPSNTADQRTAQDRQGRAAAEIRRSAIERTQQSEDLVKAAAKAQKATTYGVGQVVDILA